MSDHLIVPHGGKLVTLLVEPERAAELKAGSRDWPSWDLTPRQLCDLELLLSGGLSPLDGFLGQADYEAVCGGMRLANGTLWPIPVTLDLPEGLSPSIGLCVVEGKDTVASPSAVRCSLLGEMHGWAGSAR